VDAIVSDCGSCSAFLRKYPDLLGPAAQSVAERVRDFTQIALALELPSLPAPLRVTYHDPCHLARGQGVRAEPRQLLQRAGCELVELQEADWCCGGAGTYNVMHPDLSLRILARKMANVGATEAEVVATACPACIIQLQYGARHFGPAVQVKHVAEILAEALERHPPA
jgi:glycolate oxidase iron-sulfur subunit